MLLRSGPAGCATTGKPHRCGLSEIHPQAAAQCDLSSSLRLLCHRAAAFSAAHSSQAVDFCATLLSDYVLSSHAMMSLSLCYLLFPTRLPTHAQTTLLHSFLLLVVVSSTRMLLQISSSLLSLLSFGVHFFFTHPSPHTLSLSFSLCRCLFAPLFCQPMCSPTSALASCYAVSHRQNAQPVRGNWTRSC